MEHSLDYSQIPAVYIACLASYNNGVHHGSWIPLDGSVNVTTAIQEILNSSPCDNAEEWALHDSQCCNNLSEFSSIETLIGIQEAFYSIINEGHNWELFTMFCESMGLKIESESIEKFTDRYAGSADNLEYWCEEFLESTGELEQVPASLRFYINFKSYAIDLEINDVFCLHQEGLVHVFWRF